MAFKNFNDAGYKAGDMVRFIGSGDNTNFKRNKIYTLVESNIMGLNVVGIPISYSKDFLYNMGAEDEAAWEKVHYGGLDEELTRKISVMVAFNSGQKIQKIEKCAQRYQDWVEDSNPDWNWNENEYRIYSNVPDSITWSHVNPKYKFMARDKDGVVFLYINRPTKCTDYWSSETGEDNFYIEAEPFASYVKGTCPWSESLLARPE